MKESSFRCPRCGEKTFSVEFSRQVEKVKKMTGTNNIWTALMVPSVAPHGMIECTKCDKIIIVSYAMLARLLCPVQEMPYPENQKGRI